MIIDEAIQNVLSTFTYITLLSCYTLVTPVQCMVAWHSTYIIYGIRCSHSICSHNLYRTLCTMCVSTTDIQLFTSRSAISGIFYHGKSIHFTHYFTIKWLKNDGKITIVCLSIITSKFCYGWNFKWVHTFHFFSLSKSFIKVISLQLKIGSSFAVQLL